MRRPLRSVAFFGIALAMCGLACAEVLGIEDLAVRVVDAGVVVPDVIDAPATPTGCVPSDASYCRSLCPAPDFCEDFEQASANFEQWNGGAALALGVGNRVLNNPENVLEPRADPTDQVNDTKVLFASTLAKDKSVSLALLGHGLQAPEGGAPIGVHVRIATNVRNLEFTRADAALEDQFIYTFGIGDTVSNEGVAVMLERKNLTGDFYLAFQQRSILSNKNGIRLGAVTDLDIDTLRNNWFTFELVIGTEDTLRAFGTPCRLQDDDGNEITYRELPGATADGLRLLMKFTLVTRCLALRNQLNDPAWLTKPNILAGLAISDTGAAEVRADNLAITFIQ